MDARQFHHQHHNPVTSFDDVMDLCVDDDMMKQEPPGVSPHEPGISPPSVTTTTTSVVGDDQPAFVTYRLDQEDSAGSSAGSGVQQVVFDTDVAAAADLCLSDALRLPCVPAERTDASSPSETDMYSAARHSLAASAQRTSPGQCKVCGDEATGMYFGALVCVPCKVQSSFVLHDSVTGQDVITVSPLGLPSAFWQSSAGHMMPSSSHSPGLDDILHTHIKPIDEKKVVLCFFIKV